MIMRLNGIARQRTAHWGTSLSISSWAAARPTTAEKARAMSFMVMVDVMWCGVLCGIAGYRVYYVYRERVY
jgi:hypothetical protein